MYRTLVAFLDRTDPERHVYNVGDEFPREGVEVADPRIEQLATKDNAVGVPLIAKEEEPKKATKKKGRAAKVENNVEGNDGDMRLS